MKKFIFSLFSLSMILGLVPTMALASEEPEASTNIYELTEAEKVELNQMWNEVGIPFETQVELVAKLENGQPLDANNPNAEPLTEPVTVNYTDENGMPCTVTRVVYPDGSVAQYGISGGSSESGSGYVNYYDRLVKNNVGTMTGSFYSDYTYVQYGYDYISRIYDYDISGIGSVSSVQFEIVQRNETSSSPATAYLKYQFKDGDYTTTQTHALYVGGDSAWDEGW